MPRTALIFGSTGLIGSHVLKSLASSSLFEKVTLVNRRNHPDQDLIKSSTHIEEVRFGYEDWTQIEHLFTAETSVFICIGTTRSKTPDKEKYQHIDRDIPISIAQMAQNGNCASVQVVSAMGADADSNVFYNRTKGEMENGIKSAYSAGSAVFYRPGLLLGDRQENRIGETIGEWIFWIADPFLRGNSAKYRSIRGEDVARAMIFAANRVVPSATVYYDTMLSWSRALGE
ncbi:MAG: NAD(P)H-binding protein [Balneolales bacterium]|nr:NAD(P)H-binding protein [Balneolales bacterium]